MGRLSEAGCRTLPAVRNTPVTHIRDQAALVISAIGAISTKRGPSAFELSADRILRHKMRKTTLTNKPLTIRLFPGKWIGDVFARSASRVEGFLPRFVGNHRRASAHDSLYASDIGSDGAGSLITFFICDS